MEKPERLARYHVVLYGTGYCKTEKDEDGLVCEESEVTKLEAYADWAKKELTRLREDNRKLRCGMYDICGKHDLYSPNKRLPCPVCHSELARLRERCAKAEELLRDILDDPQSYWLDDIRALLGDTK